MFISAASLAVVTMTNEQAMPCYTSFFAINWLASQVLDTVTPQLLIVVAEFVAQ